MTNEMTRIKIEYNNGPQTYYRTELWYAVSPQTLSRAQQWVVAASAKGGLDPRAFAEWLGREQGAILDRTDGPAYFDVIPGRTVEEWRINGLLDRADGPAVTVTGDQGARVERWYTKGRLSERANGGPNCIITRKDGHCVKQWLDRCNGSVMREETEAGISSVPGVALYQPRSPGP